MAPRRSPRGPSTVLLGVVAISLAIGAAASLIVAAAAAPPFHSGVDSELLIPTWVLEVAIYVAIGLAFGLILWVRMSTTVATVPGKFAVSMLAVLLVGVLFVLVLQAAHTGGADFGGPASSPPPPSNGTSGPPGPNLTGPGGVLAPLHLPSWALFAAVAAIALVVGAVAAPRLWSYVTSREREGPLRRPTPAEIAQIQGALRVAAQDLATGADPREVIIALYAALLGRVGPIVGGVDADTPEEIRALHLVRLGIRPAAAQILTRLFEEARYSSHPLGLDSAHLARDAIDQARADLDRTPLPP